MVAYKIGALRMIKDRKVAKEISDIMIEFGKKINDSIALVQKSCTDEEFDAYRKVAGRIMGNVLIDIMNPLYGEHPDIKPKELD